MSLAEESTHILLIRHASNDYIATGRLAGRTPGVHLDDRGKQEAQALAERLASVPLAAVYSSTLERALETAGPIAYRHGIAVYPLEGLVETDCGEWTGASIDEVSRTDLWRLIQALPSYARHPGGESMTEVQTRMVAAIEKVRFMHPGRWVALISHSDPIRLALAFYAGLHMDMFQRLAVDPASISELEFSLLRPRLLRCNDRAHLPADASERE
jgi:probable phosphoglycerate mutase